MKKKEVCYGCTACVNICPVQAMKMKEDEKGFLYPIIDKDKCTECGLCNKICKFETPKSVFHEKHTYVGYHINKNVVTTSQSGGVFTAFSDKILESRGVVFGVSIKEDFKAIHKMASSKMERDLMRGSKYIQSELGDSFQEVERKLHVGKVLFVGTPCEINGLNNYLTMKNGKIENLHTIDIICHGVPSPKVWNSFFNWFREKKNGTVKKVNFRDKSYEGWGAKTHWLTIEWMDKRENYYIEKDKLYANMFYTNLLLRPCCYECPFCNVNRCSDITIGDAWGIHTSDELYNDAGCSIIMVNSEKGKVLFEDIKENLNYKKVDLNDFMQGNLKIPSKANRNVETFWKDYQTKSFQYIIEKYGKNRILLNLDYCFHKILRQIGEK